MDKSNGYEGIALHFLNGRGIAINGIGTSSVRGWAKSVPLGSVVLDLGLYSYPRTSHLTIATYCQLAAGDIRIVTAEKLFNVS